MKREGKRTTTKKKGVKGLEIEQKKSKTKGKKQA